MRMCVWFAAISDGHAEAEKVQKREAEAAGIPVGHDAFHRLYVCFVKLISARQLGGMRAAAEKPQT
jgi:hypothetical protein